MTGAGTVLLLASIALAALLAGRLFVGALGGKLFRRFDPAGGAAALAVGTAALTLLSVTLSGAGFPTRDLPLLIAALWLVPTAVCVRRQRLDALRPRGAAREWTSLLVPMAVTAALALLPVTKDGGFSFGNDTYTYSAFSEWLQGHAFSEKCRWEAQSPVTGIPALWQSQGYDLGIAHWLGLVQATVRPATVLTVYPSTSAFGLVLLTAMLWLAARQLLRLGRTWSGATALVFAAVPHALFWGHHNGFLQQGYALPLVLFGLVLFARAQPPRRWRASTAALLALPFAFLVSVYLPLLPLLGFAGAVALVPALVRARRRAAVGRLAWFAAAVAAGTAVFAARDLLGALSPLHRFATSVAGGHIPWDATEFFQFALGARVLAPGWENVEVAPWSVLNRALVPVYGAVALAGLWHAVRRPRLRPLAASAGLVALAAAYYALAVKDPWSAKTGHTWNLFKLAQWGWPFVLLLAALGVRRLAPRTRPLRLAALALGVALPVSQIGVHWPWSALLAGTLRDILPGARFDGLETLKERVQNLPPGTLLVVGRPVSAHRWLAVAAALFAYPRAVVGDWSDSASVSNHPVGGEALYSEMLERWNDPHVVPLLVGFVPFQVRGVEELGGGFARLLHQRDPVLIRVSNPTGVEAETPSGGPRFNMGKGRTKIIVFAPVRGSARLQLTLRPYPGRPGTRLLVFLTEGDSLHRNVRQASEGTPVAILALGGGTSLDASLELPQGLSTIVAVVEDGRGLLDDRPPVTVVGLSLEPA